MRRFLSKLLNPRCVYINLYNSISEIPRYFKITNYLNKKQNFIEFNNFKKNKDFFYKIRESFLSIFISSYEKDIDLVLRGKSDEWSTQVLNLIARSASRRYKASASRYGNFDFQFTRGLLGVSM